MTTEQNLIPIGKLLRADASSFVAGCRVKDMQNPKFGALVKVALEDGDEIFGLIQNIVINDDGLVRQLVSGMSIPSEYTEDNRYNRNLPVEIHVLTVGFKHQGKVSHQLPPKPPMSLDKLYYCTDSEVVEFTSHGRFGYFRHILRMEDQPVEELLVSHLDKARAAHGDKTNLDWYAQACQELIVLLRDDYQRLANVLNALAELE